MSKSAYEKLRKTPRLLEVDGPAADDVEYDTNVDDATVLAGLARDTKALLLFSIISTATVGWMLKANRTARNDVAARLISLLEALSASGQGSSASTFPCSTCATQLSPSSVPALTKVLWMLSFVLLLGVTTTLLLLLFRCHTLQRATLANDTVYRSEEARTLTDNDVLVLPSIILQLALGLFWVGMTVFLGNIHRGVACIGAAGAAIAFVCAFVTFMRWA